MISKKRLEELIEQGATIYTTYGGYVSEINLHKKYDYTTDNYLFEADMVAGEVGYRKYPFNMLFETKEDAEWHKEFGCIERTERLELPTWEEDVRQDILFSASGGIRYVFMNKIKTGYSIEKENPYIIRIQKIGECDNFIDYEYTKENYILACRKCKELFLGEKDD